MSRRLEVLKSSLAKKQAEFDRRIDAHFADVKSANGQPLNDKRDGWRTIERWDRQNDALRALDKSIEKTKAAIEREEDKIANVALENQTLPKFILKMVADGELIQWRKFPNRFFVPGVEKGRFVWQSNNIPRADYVNDVPKDQFPKFNDTWKKLVAAYRAEKERETSK